VTGAPDPSAALAALYPSATPAKPDTGAAATTAPKTAATSPAPAAAPPAPAAKPPTWQAPEGAPPAKAAQPEPPRDPAATLYAEPMKTFADVVAATPLPEGDAEAAGFDIGEEGNAAREAVRSAFLASGASKEETSELWGIAAEAAHPSYQPETYEAAEATLRREWKGDFDSRLNRARTLMRDMARKHPAVAAEVRKLGLDNSARFIAAVEKAARRRGR
jgi:hypothetical protein